MGDEAPISPLMDGDMTKVFGGDGEKKTPGQFKNRLGNTMVHNASAVVDPLIA